VGRKKKAIRPSNPGEDVGEVSWSVVDEVRVVDEKSSALQQIPTWILNLIYSLRRRPFAPACG